jgi:cytochrome b pre-mRNA-processing protein 3
MRKLGGAFYGRAKALNQALAALPDRAPLEALLTRTVFGGLESPEPSALADYLLQRRGELAAAPLEALLDGETPAWAAV